MERNLTPKEREQLIQRHRQERDGRTRDRIKAVLAHDNGYTHTEIARILLLDDETVRRHLDDYEREKKISAANGGSDSKLTNRESQKLIAHLTETTYLHVKDICKYVRQEYNKKYSISGMTKWLHANKFCYKKPHAVPAKANAEEQRKFKKLYNRLKAKYAGKEPIYFADSVHPQHQTQLAYGWILKGVRKEVATTGRQYRLNFIGGICLDTHQIIHHQAEKVVDGSEIASFLVKLRKVHPEKCRIHLIWDNAGYHRDAAVKVFAKSLGIKIHYLPPYSPNLNPIERLWKIMREYVTYNKYYEKFSEFTEAILEFFRTIGRKKSILRSRITDNFQILQGPKFAS